MNNNIKDKNILLFCANFYGYDKAIKNCLIKLGAGNVILKDNIVFDDDSRDVYSKKKKIKNLFIKPEKRDLWTNELLKEVSGLNIDVLFCIQYTPFSKWFIDRLKELNPDVRTLLFLWDDIATYPKFKDYYEKFDKVYSFDKTDCIKNGKFMYLPDFYLNDTESKDNNIKYDICFIGSLNNRGVKRVKFLKELETFCKYNNLRPYLHLRYYPNPGHMNIIKWILANKETKKLFNYLNSAEKYDFMKDKNIPLSDVENIQNNSKCLVDINYGNRSGYTLNVISAIAKGKKLITTNKNIVNENFYNPNNIYVVDIDNPVFSMDFLMSETVHVDISYLRIDNWLMEIFK